MVSQRARRSGGFTYLSLIILVAIIALVAASTLKLGSVLQRSRSEQQLLEVGAAFSDALQSYADATPAGQPPQPPSLKELLKDPRFPGVRRHLRKVFVDPMTGRAEWGIVYLGDKIGVLAVYSLSDAKPVKIGNFPQRYSGFEGKNKISDWKFAAIGKSPPPAAPPGLAPNTTPVPPLLQNNPAAPTSTAPAPTPIAPPPPETGDPPNEEPTLTPEPAPAEPAEVLPQKQESI